MAGPRPIRLSKEELAVARIALARLGGATAERVLRKLDDSVREKTEIAGLSIREALTALEDVLGVGSVAFAPHPDGTWFAKVGSRIKQQQLTADDFRAAAAKIKSRGWRPPYSFERVVFGIDRIMHDGMDPRHEGERGNPPGPAEMEGL